MLSFENDYSEGAHESILQALLKTNKEQLPGYGADKYCESAKEKIRAACGRPDADVFFLTGGTQTNQVVIDSLLKSYEGVIAVKTGHISLHEAGAIEFTGHKVIELPDCGGKLAADTLRSYLKAFFDDVNNEHMTRPGVVYISFPTEYGTLYSRSELRELYRICTEYKIRLYIDGARLGYGLMSEGSDVTLADIAENCDVFYIGGTKVGALCGEAVVFTGIGAPEHFLTTVKQHGALLAKGRLLGIQFDALFTDGLYEKNSKKAINAAAELKAVFREKGYRFFIESPTNQIFIILPNAKMNELKDKVRFSFWENYDRDNTVVRFATSWATESGDIQKLKALL